MEFNVLQIILVFVWAFIIGIDQFDLTETRMICRTLNSIVRYSF